MSSDVFWKENLGLYESPTSLFLDSNVVNADCTYDTYQIELDDKIVQACLLALSEKKLNIDTLFSAVWAFLLHRYSTDVNILFGLDSVNIINQMSDIPLCVSFSNNSINEHLQLVDKYVAEVKKQDIYNYDDYLAFTNIHEAEYLFKSVLKINSAQKVSEYDKGCPIYFKVESNATLSLSLIYNASKYSAKQISRMSGHVEIILKEFLLDTSVSLNDICILQEEEKKLMLHDWNDTKIAYPDTKCLHQLFEEQVALQKDHVAVIHNNKSATYDQLNKLSNQLAHYLINMGSKPGKLIAISVNRGIKMVATMMAVSKTGAAYVPLDPNYPDDRLSFMLEDTNAPILITESSIIQGFPEHNAKVVLVDSHWDTIITQSKENPNIAVSSQNLAYVIYTSGSTGRPKGAVLNHQGRVNNFCDFNRRYSIGAKDKLLGLASISFDMSVYDVFGTLACGASLVVADSLNPQGASNWSSLMVEEGITVWHSVPALMEMLVDHVESHNESCPHTLRLVLLGGDWIPVALPDRLKALINDVHVVSMGGATECSMDSTIYDIDEPSSNMKSIPYGFPMANQRTYILDENLLPVPINVAGELHLGGVGVGEGYLNRNKLTSEKFILNPFIQGEKIYKTGDLARFTEDGNLELLGRIDFQVKIRGFRIELGEIESSLRQHPAVKECVILAKIDNNNEKRLVAYVLEDEEYNADDISESDEQQVEQWQAVYDSAYSSASNDEDETFNIVSWDSSYTSEPYSKEVMQIWVESTVERILRHNPKSVLEIGCGTGLLLFKIAPTCKLYTGTDISNVALEFVTKQKEKAGLSQVELHQCSGENFSLITHHDYDAVVLNSIVMDFPNIDYLTEVITGAVKRIRSGGTFFIGDVRDKNSLRAFHTSVETSKSLSSSASSELQQKINRQISIEEEMLISPNYFLLLKTIMPEINGMKIQLKRGQANNEMTRYRYDVTLFIGENNCSEIQNWHDWNKKNLSVSEIKNLLDDIKSEPIAIRNIINARIVDDYKTIDLLKNNAGTVSDIRRAVKEEVKKQSALDPEQLWLLTNDIDVELEVHYSQVGKPEYFDAVFIPKNYDKNVITSLQLENEISISDCANNPLEAKIRRKIISKLRHYLDDMLPSYMVPSAFIILDKFPLSPNGKLNRKALPEPDNLRPELEESYLAPSNDLEIVLSDIWSQCLNIEQVGIKDGFIALGGNSLTATQVISRIRDIYRIELPISYGFNSTILELAEQLTLEGRKEDIDVLETSSFYIQISNMSESEMENMLN